MMRRPPRSTLVPYHDALPIWKGNKKRDGGREIMTPGAGARRGLFRKKPVEVFATATRPDTEGGELSRSDRKSTRLNSSHANISYAGFCLKKLTALLYYHTPRA